VVQQTTGQLVSAPVAQVLAGVAKIFVGEIVEKGDLASIMFLLAYVMSNLARAIQERQGEKGPLTPEHLRKAYRAYQEEYGCVGPAKPLKGKKLFVR
jgi:transcription initiation factor TFIID subunit 11